MALTDTFVKQAKHSGKEGGDKHADGGGMYLLIKAGGKYWRMDYRHAGKRKTLALGVYPDLRLVKARKRREEAREQLADGVDPGRMKVDAKMAEAELAANTFKKVALEWHAMKSKSGHALVTTTKRLMHLESHIFPALGHRPISEIKAKEVLALLTKTASKGTAYTAGRLREICGQVFRFAIATERASYNPTFDLRGVIETPTVQHRPALTTRREFGEFVRDLKRYEGGYLLTKLAAQFALLTWTRPQEMRFARWEEFDLEASRSVGGAF